MSQLSEEIISLKKLYKFLKKHTNQLKKKTFITFITEIVNDNIFSKNILNEINGTKKKSTKKYIRIMNKVFYDKQQIKHTIGYDNEWIASYDKQTNKIIYNGTIFNSLNKFTQAHYEKIKPYRNKKNNAWLECTCYKNGEWISTYDLPEIN